MTLLSRRVKRGWMPLKIVDIVDETHDTKTFVFEDADEGGRPFDFDAGQYLTFRFDKIAVKPLVRSYTMSGSPMQKEQIFVTVKRVELGLVSNWMCDQLKVGDVLKARGPIGRFCFYPNQDSTHLFMIAGGSGVTPFKSILREFMAGTFGASLEYVALLVAYRSDLDLINWDVLSEVQKRNNADVKVALTRQEKEGFLYGRPNEQMLCELFAGRYDEATVMTCGPEAIMELAVDHARRHGVSSERIKTESFSS